MAAVKAGPVVAADVDPATVKTAVGGYVCHAAPISFNDKAPVTTLVVRNTGDRPVQVGSHFHFFEVNPALEFDRAAAFGLRLEHTCVDGIALRARRPARGEPGAVWRQPRGVRFQQPGRRSHRRCRWRRWQGQGGGARGKARLPLQGVTRAQR